MNTSSLLLGPDHLPLKYVPLLLKHNNENKFIFGSPLLFSVWEVIHIHPAHAQ